MKKAVIAGLLVAGAPAFAQEWPASKPIRVVVPYSPGGGVDFVARAVSQRLGEVLKATIVVENRTGASGTIGAVAVAKSDPDGYTILIASPAEVVVGQYAGQKMGYQPERDLAPVTLIGETPLVIAAHPSGPKTFDELIAAVKAAPGKYSYGTPGAGSTMHFAGESLNAIAKLDLQHVGYRGAAPAITDLVAGQIPVGIVGMPPVLPFMKSGKLNVLAVTSGKRSATLPDVPTVAEHQGYANYRFTNWMGMYVPAKTPKAVIDKLASAVTDIVKEPAMKEKLLTQGVEPAGGAPADFEKFLQAERQTYSTIAKERSIVAGP